MQQGGTQGPNPAQARASIIAIALLGTTPAHPKTRNIIYSEGDIIVAAERQYCEADILTTDKASIVLTYIIV